MKSAIDHRKDVFVLCLLLVFSTLFTRAYAQAFEVQQLLLNVEKLGQLKNILADMQKGYRVLNDGYNAVSGIAEGSFSLHEVFLDGLLLVGPEVKKYDRIADIIRCQREIVSEYRSAFRHFKASGYFSPHEIDYLGKVYRQLFEHSLDNLNELAIVITSSKLRMDDGERLRAIDRIFADTEDKLMFLRSFNRETGILNLLRQKEQVDLNSTKRYYNLN